MSNKLPGWKNIENCFLRTISQNTEKTVSENKKTENRDRTDSDLNPTTQPFYLYSLMKLLHHSCLHQISYMWGNLFFFFFEHQYSDFSE